MVLGITYISLIFGELVPKQIALNAPEKIAALLARPLKHLSKVSAPVVFLLDGSTRLILRLLGVRPSDDPPITEEELKHLLKLGTRAGVFEEGEQEIVARCGAGSGRARHRICVPFSARRSTCRRVCRRCEGSNDCGKQAAISHS